MMTLVPLNVRLREREAIWQQRMAGGVAVAVAVGLGEWGIGRKRAVKETHSLFGVRSVSAGAGVVRDNE